MARKATARSRKADSAAEEPPLALPLVDIIARAETAIGSLQDLFDALDASILSEFKAIGKSISRARSDVAELHPGDLSQKHIPEAGRELAAIIEATEAATHQIMESAERMLEIAGAPGEDFGTVVETEVMKIFEACTFQDITGQRVAKVVHALEDIDDRVNRIAHALGAGGTGGRVSDREAARKARDESLILNGPQIGGGVAQDEIDALFG